MVTLGLDLGLVEFLYFYILRIIFNWIRFLIALTFSLGMDPFLLHYYI